MLTQTAASEPVLVPWRPGIWRVALPQGRAVLAGVTDRSATFETLRAHLRGASHIVTAQHVHGASVAAVEAVDPSVNPIPGCDALLTQSAGVAVAVRCADCLPLILWDPVRQAGGVAHAGWRGLTKSLPIRAVSALRVHYHTAPEDLWVAIGPSIRRCCYEVGEEFAASFGSFVRRQDGRWTCDLIGYAVQQLLSAGVRASRLRDSGVCTACDTGRWYSVRREGDATGRMVSFIVIR